MTRVFARDLVDAHRQHLLGGVAQSALRYAAMDEHLDRHFQRRAFREAWREFTMKAVVAAEYAIAEQIAREQLEAVEK